MGLSDLFARLRHGEGGPTPASDAVTHPTRALGKFLSVLQHREQPVLLDLGPVAGGNLSLFGEQLGCKVHVEDLYADLEHLTREGRPETFAASLTTRFPQPDDSVDGILCWDLFDYLDKPAAQALASQLVRLVRPDGVILAFFAATALPEGTPAAFTRFHVVDPQTLQFRSHPASRPKGKPLANRDVQRLFEPLRITDQFLLKHNVREVLFRKAAA